jgi:putative two-component system response regulator
MQELPVKDASILIVDDEPVNVRLLERMLQSAGYVHIISTTDARRAVPLVIERNPDLILLDLHMPHLSGTEVLTLLGPHIPRGAFLPVLVLTADVTREAKQQALARGATDFLTKPFDAVEVILRIRNLLRLWKQSHRWA